MGRPRKIKQPLVDGIVIPERPAPQIIDPNFGYPRPAPKPIGGKKRGRPSKEENSE